MTTVDTKTQFSRFCNSFWNWVGSVEFPSIAAYDMGLYMPIYLLCLTVNNLEGVLCAFYKEFIFV